MTADGHHSSQQIVCNTMLKPRNGIVSFRPVTMTAPTINIINQGRGDSTNSNLGCVDCKSFRLLELLFCLQPIIKVVTRLGPVLNVQIERTMRNRIMLRCARLRL